MCGQSALMLASFCVCVLKNLIQTVRFNVNSAKYYPNSLAVYA